MKELRCESCGSVKFHKLEDGAYECDFCGTKYYKTKEDEYVLDSSITLREDISAVLKKWEKDPDNGRQYARLILQLDHTNKKAIAELSKEDKTKEGGCYVATAVYGSYNCPEVWTLRRFRDYNLAKTWYGRAFVRTYYAVSPAIVKWFGKTQWFNNLCKSVLDRMVVFLKTRGYEDTPYDDNY